ncbi:MAG: response regulator [Deltaproteobacteria bacterium]|nr:response regulator [Deltaproteobacteria bacterium]
MPSHLERRAAASESATGPGGAAAANKATVLVIDDSPTILRVVELVLKKGGYGVITASDGAQGLEKAKSERPDLVLLDFIMPRMNGYQVCKAMTADAELKSIPIVLMSAKGDKIGDKFVQVLGIVDYITKPFSPEAILAVASHTLEKFRPKGAAAKGDSGRAEGAAKAKSDLTRTGEHDHESDGLTAARPDGVDRAAVEAEGRRRAADRLAHDVAGQIVASTGEERDRLEATLKDALRVAIERLGAETSAVGLAGAMAGDLRVFPLADVLQLLQLEAQTGVFTVRHGEKHARVFMRAGRVALVTSGGLDEEFRLGRYLVEKGLLSGSDLDQLLRARRDGKRRLGGQLVQLGYITLDDLRAAILRQSSEIIYEALRWSHGSFSFAPFDALPDEARDANLDVSVEGLLMEGFRRVDEWHFIEAQIDNFHLVFARCEDVIERVGIADLTHDEQLVLGAIDGKRSVKAIIRFLRMSSFDVCKMLFRLLSIHVVRKVGEAAA